MPDRFGTYKPEKWDEVIDLCYVKKEITATEAMKRLKVSKTDFYRLLKGDPRFNSSTKSLHGGMRGNNLEEVKELKVKLNKSLEDYKILEEKHITQSKTHKDNTSLLSNQLTQYRDRIKELEGRTVTLQNQLTQSKTNQDDTSLLSNQLTQSKSELSLYKDRISQLEERSSSLEKENKKLKLDISQPGQSEKEVKDLESQINKLKEKNQQLGTLSKEIIKEKEDTIASLLKSNKGLSDSLEDMLANNQESQGKRKEKTEIQRF